MEIIAPVQLADGKRTSSTDPGQFLSNMLGVGLPIAALPYWLQAVPLPRVTFRVEVDPFGRPALLWQDGWQVMTGEIAVRVARSAEDRGTEVTLRR